MIPRVELEARVGGWPSPAIVRALARRVRRAARAMGCTRAQLDALELRIVDDPRMRVIKERSFGVAEATDVLSFPAPAPIPGQEGEVGGSLGEIVINRDAVARQAARPGPAGWLDEATALAIHGVAHLRGHDHDCRARARRMLANEQQGSRAVGLPCTRPYGAPPRARRVVPRRAAPDDARDDARMDDLGDRDE